MIEFKKYSSIENSFNREFMERIMAELPADMQFVVQEKVHEANTSFLCDGKEVKFAKRTSVLADDEKFYDFPELLQTYRERVLRLFERIKANHPDVTQISVFGEMRLPKDFGKIMGMFSKDALQNFLKEHGSTYMALDKCEQKSLNRELNKLCTAFVKEVYMSHAYIIK